MHTLAGEEGGAPALAPASPVKIEPASDVVGGGGTGSLLRSLWGGADDPPSSSCRRPKDPAAAAAVAAAAPAWWKGGGGGVIIIALLFLWLAVFVRVALLLLLCSLVYTIPGCTQGHTKPKHSHDCLLVQNLHTTFWRTSENMRK